MICTDKFPYSELEGYPRNQVIAYYEKARVAGESVVYIPFLAAISTAAIFGSRNLFLQRLIKRCLLPFKAFDD